MALLKLGKWGDFTLVIGVITQVISGRGPNLYEYIYIYVFIIVTLNVSGIFPYIHHKILPKCR